MKTLIIPSIPYDTSGWREHGCKRVTPPKFKPKYYETYDILINLGAATALYNSDGPAVYNPGPTGYYTGSVLVSKKILGDLMPPEPSKIGELCWFKKPGSKGVGKMKTAWAGNGFYGSICQTHVEGKEYRVITVGETVVQVHEKQGDVFEGFDFVWTGVHQAGKIVGLIPTAKKAAKKLVDAVGSNRLVIGWDIIVNDQGGWLLEGNSAPGVNAATAGRIMDAIKLREGFV